MKKTFRIFALCSMALALAFTSCTKPEEGEDINNDPNAIPALTVSHEVQKRNAFIEEYTGVQCGYCPDGHAIARQLMENNPGRVIAVNIHQGGYATRYTTSFGNMLASQAGITGYPCGTVNRNSSALSRGQWANACKQVMAENSCVNLAARAIIDTTTKEMTLDIKGYYTDNSAAETNKLSVMILQNDVVGPQSNYGNYNQQAYDEHGNYHHMHMLRHMLSAVWGDEISNTTQGSEFDKNYTYTFPAKIGDVNVDLPNMQVVVFVAESKKDVITAIDAEIILR